MSMRPPDHLRLVYNDVLVRSVLEYRHALKVIEDIDGAIATSEHVVDMIEDLRRFEAELEKRGIDAASIMPESFAHSVTQKRQPRRQTDAPRAQKRMS